MEPTNRRQGVRSSEGRKRVSRHGFKYSTSPPPVRSPFDSSRDAYRAALDRTQEALLTRDRLRSRRASVRRFHRAGLLPATLSEKLVSAVAETASSITLQEADDSSSEELLDTSSMQESMSASPGTVTHNVKLVAGASESASASAQTLGEADVSSLEELNTASLQELVTASLRTAPCNNTLDSSSTTSPFRREKTVAGVAESAHAQVMRELELDQFIAEELLGYSSSEDLTTTSTRAVEHNVIDGRNQRTLLRNTTDDPLSSASSLGSKILKRQVPHCFYWYYIRMDRRGSFRTYPDRGGPFQSLQEAEDAIDHYHDGLWCQSWHDVQEIAGGGGPYSSTRKVSEVDTYRYLVEALLDQYNEDNNLIGNLAHELDEDSMMEQWIYEDHSYYYHYNFTTKKNEAGDISLGACTFFAEVSHKLGEHALEVNCCCKMEDEDNGWCYGCKNNGSHGMRHPKNLEAYTGGHLDVFLPCTLEEASSSDDEEAEETRLRNISKENPLSFVSGSLFLQQASTVEC